MSRLGLAAILLAALGTVAGCGEDDLAGPPIGIELMSIQPQEAEVDSVGATVDFDAREEFDGRTIEADTGFSWSVGDTAVARVDRRGTATAAARGTTVVTATSRHDSAHSASALLRVVRQ